jgi:hypothetical protein
VVLNDESQADFDSLLNGFREDFQPVGTIEEALVEKLAALHWRYRRVLVAESAEISKAFEFVDWESEHRQLDSANEILLAEATAKEDEDLEDKRNGLIQHVSNPNIAARCIALLEDLHKDVETNGLDREQAEGVLSELYGKFGLVENTVRTEYE